MDTALSPHRHRVHGCRHSEGIILAASRRLSAPQLFGLSGWMVEARTHTHTHRHSETQSQRSPLGVKRWLGGPVGLSFIHTLFSVVHTHRHRPAFCPVPSWGKVTNWLPYLFPYWSSLKQALGHDAQTHIMTGPLLPLKKPDIGRDGYTLWYLVTSFWLTQPKSKLKTAHQISQKRKGEIISTNLIHGTKGLRVEESTESKNNQRLNFWMQRICECVLEVTPLKLTDVGL